MKSSEYHAGEAPKRDADNRKRRSYLNDFRRTAGGEYIYNGKVFSLQSHSYPFLLKRFFLYGCGAFLFVLAAGFLPGAGMDSTFYVLLPFAAAVGFTGSLVWAYLRLQFADRPVRAYVYKGAVRSVPRRCLFSAITLSLKMCCQIVFLILNKKAEPLWGLFADFMLTALSITFCFLLRSLFLRTEWQESA